MRSPSMTAKIVKCLWGRYHEVPIVFQCPDDKSVSYFKKTKYCFKPGLWTFTYSWCSSKVRDPCHWCITQRRGNDAGDQTFSLVDFFFSNPLVNQKNWIRNRGRIEFGLGSPLKRETIRQRSESRNPKQLNKAPPCFRSFVQSKSYLGFFWPDINREPLECSRFRLPRITSSRRGFPHRQGWRRRWIPLRKNV